MCYILLILLVIFYLYDFIVIFFDVSLGDPTSIPLATNGRNNPTQPPLVKRGGVVRSTFRHLSQQTAQDLCKRQGQGSDGGDVTSHSF